MPRSLTDYLYDPLKNGVVHGRLSIPKDAILRYCEILKKLIRKRHRGLKGLQDKLDVLTWRERRAPSNQLQRFLNRVINDPLMVNLVLFENAKSPLGKHLELFRAGGRPGRRLSRDRLSPLYLRAIGYGGVDSSATEGAFTPFGPHVPLSELGDALHISEEDHPGIVILNVSSVAGTGLERFLQSIQRTPVVGPVTNVVTRRDEYSSRIVFDAVPPAVAAWIEQKSVIEHVPAYVIDYLRAATSYLEKSEWRTSVTLSSIATESLLAELFEEEFHKEAPDIPLGTLKEKIKEYYRSDRRSPPFPREVEESIDLTNQARIAAVHRGNVQLSIKETTDALRGTVKFVIWYHFKK